QSVHFCAVPVFSLKPMTPYGQAEMQSRQPLHTLCWMSTVPNSVRTIAFVGHTSRHDACWQCLQTSDIISHASPPAIGVGITAAPPAPLPLPFVDAVPSAFGNISTNCTCRQFCASSWPVLSYESAVN